VNGQNSGVGLGAFWFRVPDDESVLMSLSPAQLKCYLVVVRAIQRDRNGGKISTRQVAGRAGLGLRHAHDALNQLVDTKRLQRDGKAGTTANYSLPNTWNAGNCIPTGEQLRRELTANRLPTGKQHCSPLGEQHLESSEKHTLSADSGRLKEPSATDSLTASASPFRNEQPFPTDAPKPPANWPLGGWQSREDFETWWSGLVLGHPNRNYNTAGKAKALELIRAGQLERGQFEGGYAALRAANSARWAEQDGRFVPNLLRILDDSLWDLTPRPPAVSEYQDAEIYLRRVANE
jgi:hypothetical protein